jgi:hypothetical protein
MLTIRIVIRMNFIDIPIVFLSPHNVGLYCINVIRVHSCVLDHSCASHFYATVSSSLVVAIISSKAPLFLNNGNLVSHCFSLNETLDPVVQ